jgi:ribosomal protein S18 acetylase RimI-like enzyme
MLIKPATDEDIARLGEMNKRLIEDERDPNPMSVPELTERMRAWLSSEYSCYIVWDADTPVAYCLYREEEDHFFLRQLFVERGHRRSGIATTLLDWMFKNCWKSKPVRLNVHAHNEEAIAFYRSYGFTVRVLGMSKE